MLWYEQLQIYSKFTESPSLFHSDLNVTLILDLTYILSNDSSVSYSWKHFVLMWQAADTQQGHQTQQDSIIGCWNLLPLSMYVTYGLNVTHIHTGGDV